LLLNNSFESGLTNWTYAQSGAATGVASSDSTTSTDGTKSLKVQVTTVDPNWWYIKEEQGNIRFISGVQYTISYDAKASSNGKLFTLEVGPNGAYSAQTQSLTTQWKTYTTTFVPNSTNTSVLDFYYARPGNANTTIWLDNVKLTTNTTVSRVQNASFETNPLTPWYVGVTAPAVGTVTQSAGGTNGSFSAHANITTAGAADWNLQLSQQGIPVFNGSTYTVQFDAMANVARTLGIYVQQSQSPYAVYGSNTFNITTAWKSYSYTFQSGTTDTNAAIRFNFATSTGDVYIDNVAVTSYAPVQLCSANGTSLDKRLNVTGSIVVSASGPGQGVLNNQRDLCTNDNCPSISFTKGGGGAVGGNGLSYILNAPAFLKRRTHKWQELAPINAPTPTPTP
jgi:hypothetical protein